MNRDEILKLLPRTLSEARASGQKYFYPNMPCRNGHVEMRVVHSGKRSDCVQCVADGVARWYLNKQMRLAEAELVKA